MRVVGVRVFGGPAVLEVVEIPERHAGRRRSGRAGRRAHRLLEVGGVRGRLVIEF